MPEPMSIISNSGMRPFYQPDPRTKRGDTGWQISIFTGGEGMNIIKKILHELLGHKHVFYSACENCESVRCVKCGEWVKIEDAWGKWI
jgi:hypothetical protein